MRACVSSQAIGIPPRTCLVGPSGYEDKVAAHLHPSIHWSSSQISETAHSESILHPHLLESPIPLPKPKLPQTGRSDGQLAFEAQPGNSDPRLSSLLVYLWHRLDHRTRSSYHRRECYREHHFQRMQSHSLAVMFGHMVAPAARDTPGPLTDSPSRAIAVNTASTEVIPSCPTHRGLRRTVGICVTPWVGGEREEAHRSYRSSRSTRSR